MAIVAEDVEKGMGELAVAADFVCRQPTQLKQACENQSNAYIFPSYNISSGV